MGNCSSSRGGSGVLARERRFLKKLFEWRFLKLSKVKDRMQPGDILEFKRRGYSHFGLYLGDGMVMHVQVGSGNKEKDATTARVCRSTLQEVCGSSKVRIRNMEKQALRKYNLSPLPSHRIIENAERAERQGIVNYQLLGENCEYNVTLWRYGAGFSLQAECPILYTHGGRKILATGAAVSLLAAARKTVRINKSHKRLFTKVSHA